MADLALKIRADFDEAARQFKSLADTSDYTREKIERFIEKTFKPESIDKFIDRQDLLATAMQATGRNTDAVNAQVQNYQREIERLIKSGLNPQDEALQKLQAKYAELLTEQDRAKQSAEAETEAARQLAAENAKLAAAWAATADAGTDYEKKIAELSHRKKELKEEIERLIKSGLSPESEEIKKLEGEYKNLTKEIQTNEAAHKAQEKAAKIAAGTLAAIGAAFAAAGGYALKAAAANEDMIASFVPMMNGSVEKATELFKTIQKEAATTPFEIDRIAASVRTLMPAFGGSAKAAKDAFRMLGDTAQGNSQKLESITNAYTAVMLKGKVSMKELNTIAGAGVPIYTELAKSMGVTEAEMMRMSSNGKISAADLTKAFQQMTSEGGIFFNGMETASDTFNMRLLGIKENMGILAGVIGERLLPAAKNIAGAVLKAVENFTTWIQTGDNFTRMTDIMTYALAGLAAGLTAFLVVTKGAAALQAMATAFRVLNAAIAANPIGAIAVVITAVLIPALIYLYKNWDTVQTYLSQGVARLEYAFKWFGSVIKEKLLVAFAAIKAAGATLVDFIYGNIIRGVGKMLEVMGKLPFVGEMFDKASRAVSGLGNAMGGMAAQARAAVAETIKSAHEEQQATEQALKDKLAAVDAEAQARRAAIAERKKQSSEELQADAEAGAEEIKQVEAIEAAKTAIVLSSLKDRLNKIALTENQKRNEQINLVAQFLQQRVQLESGNLRERRALLLDMQKTLIADLEEGSEERIAIESAVAEAIKEIDRKLYEERLALVNHYNGALGDAINNIAQVSLNVQKTELEERLKAFDDASKTELENKKLTEEQKTEIEKRQSKEREKIINEANKKAYKAAVAQRALSNAQAIINTYLAASKALAEFGFPAGIAAMAATIVQGMANVALLNSTPIPKLSAETGGRFVVPDVSPRVDSVGLRVNPGEIVNVTPRGEDGEAVFNFIFKMNEQVVWEVVNRGARAGALHTIQLARNV